MVSIGYICCIQPMRNSVKIRKGPPERSCTVPFFRTAGIIRKTQSEGADRMAKKRGSQEGKVRTPVVTEIPEGRPDHLPAEEPVCVLPAGPPVPMRRRMVLVSEDELRKMDTAFAEGREAIVVTVHAVPPSSLTDGQREKRKAYRQRPEVREKQRAYRRERAKRIRAAKKAAAAPAPEQAHA